MTEAAVEPGGVVVAPPAVPAGGYHVPVHGAQVLEEVGLLLEHGDTESARERLLPRVHTQMGLEVPAHAELLAAVLTPILPGRGRLSRRLPGGGLAGLRGLGRRPVALAVPRCFPGTGCCCGCCGYGGLGAGAGAAPRAVPSRAVSPRAGPPRAVPRTGAAPWTPPRTPPPIAVAEAPAAVRALVLRDGVVVGAETVCKWKGG